VHKSTVDPVDHNSGVAGHADNPEKGDLKDHCPKRKTEKKRRPNIDESKKIHDTRSTHARDARLTGDNYKTKKTNLPTDEDPPTVETPASSPARSSSPMRSKRGKGSKSSAKHRRNDAVRPKQKT